MAMYTIWNICHVTDILSPNDPSCDILLSLPLYPTSQANYGIPSYSCSQTALATVSAIRLSYYQIWFWLERLDFSVCQESIFRRYQQNFRDTFSSASTQWLRK